MRVSGDCALQRNDLRPKIPSKEVRSRHSPTFAGMPCIILLIRCMVRVRGPRLSALGISASQDHHPFGIPGGAVICDPRDSGIQYPVANTGSMQNTTRIGRRIRAYRYLVKVPADAIERSSIDGISNTITL